MKMSMAFRKSPKTMNTISCGVALGPMFSLCRMREKLDRMNLKIAILLMTLLGAVGLSAANQVLQAESIENVRAEVKNDSLIVSFDLNTIKKIESLWIEIRTTSGEKITNNSLDNRSWNKVASSQNSKIVWAYALDKADLPGKDILIEVKANVGEEVAAIPPPIFQKPIETKPQKIDVAKFPQFRLGSEIMIDPTIGKDYGHAAYTLTGEYIVKPSWSILSGVGLHVSGERYYNNEYKEDDENDYVNITVPLTAEYKLNTGRLFRLYGGGGILNKFLVYEGDEYLNVGQGLKRYVFGLRAEAGIELRNWRMGVVYDKDITSYSVFNEKISYLGITLGLRFGGSNAYLKNKTSTDQF